MSLFLTDGVAMPCTVGRKGEEKEYVGKGNELVSSVFTGVFVGTAGW
jgi:hypothetical protein